MLEKIEALLAEVAQLTATSLDDVEKLRIKYISKKGLIPSLMNDFRSVPAELKKETGIKINELKTKALEKINALRDGFATSDVDDSDFDVTRTGYPLPRQGAL